MRVVIVGAGGVGFHLAKYLVESGHDVVIVEADAERAAQIGDQLDALVIQGNGAALPVLQQLGLHRADLLLALTGNDQVNLIMCLAASRLGTKIKVARVSDPDFHAKGTVLSAERLGIDMLVSPERECAWETFQLLNAGAATDLVQLADGRLQAMGLEVVAGSRLAGRTLTELDSELRGLHYIIAAVVRDGRTEIPTGQSSLLEGDRLIVLAPSREMPLIPPLAGHPPPQLDRVMIAGGSMVALYLAQHLEARGVGCTLFDRDRQRCRELAQQLPRTLVLNGDATDLDLLELEGVEGVDGFVALTNSDETNVLSGLVAKATGARKVLSLISQLDFIPIARRVGIDAAVSPRLSTVNALLRFLRGGTVQAAALFKGIDAEIEERSVGPASPVAGRPLRDIEFPAGSLVGAIVRGDDVFIPRGADMLLAGDRAIVFALPGTLPELERLFR